MFKKSLSILLAVVMLMSLAVVVVSAAEPSDKLYIRVDGNVYYEVHKGETYTYVYSLACDKKVCSLDCTTFFDAEGLKFLPDVDGYGDFTGTEFPNITAVYNFNKADSLIYNYSSPSGVRFPVADTMADKNVVFRGKFEVTAESGIFDIYTDLKVLGDSDNNKIIFDSVKVDEAAVVTEVAAIAELQPVDAPVDPTPTEPQPTEPAEPKPTVPTPTEPTEVGNILNFDANSAGWSDFQKVYCHIWVYGGDAFYAWQAKAEQCTDKDGDGIWTYDLDAKDVVLDSGKYYGVIFSNENGAQTYSLLMDASCIGGTVYCDDTRYESPQDSTKTTQVAFWKGQDPTVYGPQMCITSIGNVIGTCIPPTISAQAMFEVFLLSDLRYAQTYSGKTDQALLDDLAKALGLKREDVIESITNTGVFVDWSAYKSTLESSETTEDKEIAGKPDAKPTDEKAPATKDQSSTNDTKKPTNSNAVKTGSTAIAIAFITVLVMAAGVVMFTSKKKFN